MTTPEQRENVPTPPDPTDARSAPSATGTTAPQSNPEIIDAAEAADLPTSFGVFKPVGHVMMGLPTQQQVDSLVAALQRAGWPRTAARQFSPRESGAELRAMVENAGSMSGFGFEINLLRRYLTLTEAGYHWLLVKADDTKQAAAAAEMARGCGATLAVHYRTLTVEELIE